MNENHYYSILGCEPGASMEELRKAWRAKCLEHHPDQGGDSDKFMEVTHAYKMLTDPSYVRQQKPQQTKNLTFSIKIVVSFEDAFFGTEIVVNYNEIEYDAALEPMVTKEVIPICFKFRLPPGAMQFAHTEKGKGAKHQGQVGNAIVNVISRGHPRYKVVGQDVVVEEEVKLETMLTGAHITVETMWGTQVIWVPPGTLPGHRLRVVGCGVDRKGHQYCQVVPKYPDVDELKQAEAWKALNINWAKAEKANQEDEDLLKTFEDLKGGGTA